MITDQAARPADGKQSVPAQRVVLGGLAMLSVLAAVIHFAVSGSHFQEYWLFGVFMLGVGWLQASLAAATGAGVLAALLSVALVDGGPEMVMTAGAGPAASAAGAGTASGGMAGMNSPGSSGSTGTMAPVHLATSSPAGFITDPGPGLQMAPGMKMASPVACTTSATAAQQRAAVQLVNASWAGAQKYRSLATAKAAGYRPITPSGLPVVHYLNPAFYRDTLLGGPVLDTSQPQSLVHANTRRDRRRAPGLPGRVTEPGDPGHDARLVRAHPRRPDRGRCPGRAGGAGRRAGRRAAQRHGLSWDCTSERAPARGPTRA